MRGMRAYIDSNIFIYATAEDAKFGGRCRAFLKKIENKEIEAVTSTLAFAEALHILRKTLTAEEKAYLAVQIFLSLPINIISLDLSIFSGAMNQAQEHGLKINDAIHLTSALAADVDAICSYDKDFDRLEIKRMEP